MTVQLKRTKWTLQDFFYCEKKQIPATFGPAWWFVGTTVFYDYHGLLLLSFDIQFSLFITRLFVLNSIEFTPCLSYFNLR